MNYASGEFIEANGGNKKGKLVYPLFWNKSVLDNVHCHRLKMDILSSHCLFKPQIISCIAICPAGKPLLLQRVGRVRYRYHRLI